MQLAVEGADGLGVAAAGGGAGHFAVPENVVGGNQTAGAHQRQGAVVVIRVVGLVGVDVGEIERAGLTAGKQAVEGAEGGAEAQLHAIFHAGLAPCAAGAAGVLFVAVAGDQLAARRQGQRHPGGAVAHEDAYFERAARAHRQRQKVQQLALLGSRLQGGLGEQFGFLAQAPQRLGLAQRDLADVAGKIRGDGCMKSRHERHCNSIASRSGRVE